MASVMGEKNLAGSIQEELVDAFWATVPPGMKNKHVLAASARLWVSLPEDLRKELVIAESEGRPVQDAWVEAVRKIAAEEFAKQSRRKPPRKG